MWQLRTFLIALACTITGTSKAQIVIVVNATQDERSFNVLHTPDATPTGATLQPGEFKTLAVGQASVLRITLNKELTKHTLKPYYVYWIEQEKEGKATFQLKGYIAAMPKPDDVPAVPEVKKPLVIPIQLMADDADKRAQAVWEKSLRARVESASKFLTSQCNVTLDVKEVSEWKSDQEIKDLTELHTEFVAVAPAKPGVLMLGFTSRTVTGDALAIVPGPGTSHLLLREGVPRAEVEREEVLTHYISQYLGAVRTPFGISLMRKNLRDGAAAKAGYTIRLDPFNILIMHIWANELRAGRKTWGELSPVAKARLEVLYRSQASLHEEAKSDDNQAQEYVTILMGNKPNEPSGSTIDESQLSAENAAIRKVIRSIVKRAGENHALMANDAKKLKGDALTDEYFKVAATAAKTCEEPHRVKAFLVGLGIALDHTTILMETPLTKSVCKAVESDAERKQRAEQLSGPTIRGRRDLCQHYVVSMALTSLMGPQAAELAGLAKEISDLSGPSGFSFADLAVDLAGIELAKWVIAKPATLATIEKDFNINKHAPDIKGLREGITNEKFDKEFKVVSDPRFQKLFAEVKQRVADLKIGK